MLRRNYKQTIIWGRHFHCLPQIPLYPLWLRACIGKLKLFQIRWRSRLLTQTLGGSICLVSLFAFGCSQPDAVPIDQPVHLQYIRSFCFTENGQNLAYLYNNGADYIISKSTTEEVSEVLLLVSDFLNRPHTNEVFTSRDCMSQVTPALIRDELSLSIDSRVDEQRLLVSGFKRANIYDAARGTLSLVGVKTDDRTCDTSYFQGRYSPGGKRIAFSGGLVLDIETSRTIQLPETGVAALQLTSPVWAGDDRLVFLAKSSQEEFSLVTFDLAMKTYVSRSLPKGYTFYQSEFAVDSNRGLFWVPVVQGDGEARVHGFIEISESGDSQAKFINNADEPGFILNIRYNPIDKCVYYSARRNFSQSLYKYDEQRNQHRVVVDAVKLPKGNVTHVI